MLSQGGHTGSPAMPLVRRATPVQFGDAVRGVGVDRTAAVNTGNRLTFDVKTDRSILMHRRDFLKSSTAALAFSSFPFAEQFADTHKRVGLIGAGWYGKADLLRLVQVAPVEVVSLCDVDKKMLAEAAELVASRQVSKKTPRTYTDYRQMLKERDLDIVIIVTPDHWHALAMIDAVKSGADVWVQKPISVDVVEGQAMLAAARKYKRVVQVGLQRRSTPHLVRARDRVIREGRLGTIGLVDIH